VSTTTDVILGAGPTVVALAAIGSSVWQQRRGLAHERKLADLAAVRSVLDDAALGLQRVGDLQNPSLLDNPEAFFGRLQESVVRDFEPTKSRLTVRLGQPHALVISFEYAMDSVNDWEREAIYLSLSADEGGPTGERRTKTEQDIACIAQQFRRSCGPVPRPRRRHAGARLP
jgi:hypothetical protein